MEFNKRFCYYIFLALCLITLVNAQPPFQSQEVDTALKIFVPEIDYHPQNQGFTFNIHVINKSSGYQHNNTELNCFLHLYNSTGEHEYQAVFGKNANGIDHTIFVSGGNFSDLGTHSANFYCNLVGTIFGGGFKEQFTVNVLGEEFTTAKATSYSFTLIFSILIFIGLLILGLVLPSKNKSDEMTGYIIAIRNIKYLKYFLLGFAYVTLLWIMYFSWMITYTYLSFIFLSTIFRFMFTFLAVLTLPLFILFIYLTITNLIRDSKIKDALLRGIDI